MRRHNGAGVVLLTVWVGRLVWALNAADVIGRSITSSTEAPRFDGLFVLDGPDKRDKAAETWIVHVPRLEVRGGSLTDNCVSALVSVIWVNIAGALVQQ